MPPQVGPSLQSIILSLIGVLYTSLVGALGWAFHINARVSVVESENSGLGLLVNNSRDDLKDFIELGFEGVNRRLARIEQAQDNE